MNYRPLEFTTLVEKLDTTFDWDCVLIGFSGGGVEPNNGANFLRSSGNLHIWNPDQKTPATPWEAEIDQLLEQGTAEMDTQEARALLLAYPGDPPRPVADHRDRAPAALRRLQEFARELRPDGVGTVQTGMDPVRDRLS